MAILRRDKFLSKALCRWRLHGSVLILITLVLVVYNAVANVWLLRPLSCQARGGQEFTPVVSEAPVCEPCLDPAASNLVIDDDPISRIDLRLGRWDGSRNHRIFDNAVVGEIYPEISITRKVCLATQTSIERLHELLSISEHWTGPISIAVYVVSDELRLLRGFVTWLYHCLPEVYSRTAIHMVTSAERPAVHGTMPKWVRSCDEKPLPPGERKPDTVAWRTRHPYPQNHLRNIARKNCQTPYVFLVDIDIVPSRKMAESLDTFLATTPKCPFCAYVVPTYELDKRVANFPANKSELLRLSKNKLAVPFHKKVFIYNQYASNFSRWESTKGNESLETHISHNVTNFELLYEPFYVAPDRVPPHDERFVGYGFTRNTQVYEMFLMGYHFSVLSPIFTIHWGLQTRRTRPLWREKQNAQNRKHFDNFKRELFARYRRDPLHLLRLPQQNKKT